MIKILKSAIFKVPQIKYKKIKLIEQKKDRVRINL